MYKLQKNIFLVASLALSVAAYSALSYSVSDVPLKGEAADTKIVSDDVIARVGSEVITFSQINTMLNSSAMVGLSVPALGTQRRNKVMITLLDKAISANLLYLDARRKGADKLPMYVKDIRQFEDAVLAALYQSRELIGDIPVSEEEVSDYYKKTISPNVAFTDDVKFAIESKLRDQKFRASKSTLRKRIRQGVTVDINEKVMSSEYDKEHNNSEIVASYEGEGLDRGTVIWSDVKALMQGADKRASNSAFFVDNDEERMDRLNRVIDTRIMASKARHAGMADDPVYISRTSEYRKTRLINIYRGVLVHKWTPSDDELKDYFVENMDRIAVPEARKIQMVVVKTEGEAKAIKAEIENGEITMFQAAQKYSIDPRAKRTLGEMGWVSQGTGFAELDDFTFNLEPEQLAGPVHSPSGWHLIKVLDVRDAQMQVFDEPQTRTKTLRMYMKQKLNEYLVSLRVDSFDVAVYDAELQRHFQDEANMIAQLSEKAKLKGSVTEHRLEDLQKWIGNSKK